MAQYTLVKLTHDQTAAYHKLGTEQSANAHEGINNLMNFLNALNCGVTGGRVEIAGNAVRATGTLTLSGSSGVVGGTINGVAVTRAFATSDAVTAAALVNDINAHANALVSGHVTASSVGGVITLTAKVPGLSGNAITLAASGTGVTASGARLTGGTESFKTYAVGG